MCMLKANRMYAGIFRTLSLNKKGIDMTKTERAMFRAAKAVSEMSDHPQYKIGATVVSKHRIISSGANSDTKTHPLQKQYNKYR